MEENEKRKLSKKKPTHNLPQGMVKQKVFPSHRY
ncbi:hypothetical protein CXB51_002181 [Gossypium anomalum]|uniref:Uncharacterized protein n=1 Tax=Gossypium anomalum TaxID=47600 RepID=A0A8J6A1J4_9ROSI|nr:hypothetical protein CXB51_002181 [Gossypium anomalum]